MKSVFLDELSNVELEAFLAEHERVLVPVGATEQHGPHSPLGTDVFLPREIGRRVAEAAGDTLVAPALPYTLSYPHRGFVGEFSLRIETFMAVVRDLAISFAQSGFRQIVFLNGHYDNSYALAYACAQAAEDMPAGARAYPINHWDGLTMEELQAFGMHAGEGEASMVMAICEELVDVARLNCEHPNFPAISSPPGPVHSAFFFTQPGSVYRITRSGTWGDATGATAEKGEALLERGARAVKQVWDDIERTYAELPLR